MQTIYLYNGNKRFVEGKKKSLEYRQEVFKNIYHQLKLSKLLPTYSIGCISGVAFIVGLISFIIGVGLVALSVNELIFLSKAQLTDYEAIGLMIFSSISSLVLVGGMGVPYMIRAYLLWMYSEQTHKIYHELVEQGKIFEGKVTNLKKLADGDLQINYSFYNSDQILLEGIYFTSMDKTIQHDSKVAVLYLNPMMHILL